jgi:hypothetical protein
MKYCDDDIKKARNIISNLEYTNDFVRSTFRMVRLSEEELDDVIKAIDTLTNIVNYGNTLPDNKLNKLIKMKKIIKGE